MTGILSDPERLALLERKVRRGRAILIVLALLLLAALVGVVETFRELHDLKQWGIGSTRHSLVGEGGRELGAFGQLRDQPYLKLLDDAGHFRAFLTLEDSGPVLKLSDARGRVRLRMAVTDAGGALAILDEHGQVTWRAP